MDMHNSNASRACCPIEPSLCTKGIKRENKRNLKEKEDDGNAAILECKEHGLKIFSLGRFLTGRSKEEQIQKLNVLHNGDA